MSTPSKPETVLSRSIQDALRDAGFMCERIQSGKVKVRRGWMKLADEGTPDLWCDQGFLEVKLDGEHPTAEQVAWHARARRAGVRVAVVHSVKEALETVKAWRRER